MAIPFDLFRISPVGAMWTVVFPFRKWSVIHTPSCSMQKARTPVSFPCRSSATGWGSPCGSSLMTISLTTLSRKSNKQQERRFHSDSGASVIYRPDGNAHPGALRLFRRTVVQSLLWSDFKTEERYSQKTSDNSAFLCYDSPKYIPPGGIRRMIHLFSPKARGPGRFFAVHVLSRLMGSRRSRRRRVFPLKGMRG